MGQNPAPGFPCLKPLETLHGPYLGLPEFPLWVLPSYPLHKAVTGIYRNLHYPLATPPPTAPLAHSTKSNLLSQVWPGLASLCDLFSLPGPQVSTSARTPLPSLLMDLLRSRPHD